VTIGHRLVSRSSGPIAKWECSALEEELSNGDTTTNIEVGDRMEKHENHNLTARLTGAFRLIRTDLARFGYPERVRWVKGVFPKNQGD
jgi:hypothetical protein